MVQSYERALAWLSVDSQANSDGSCMALQADAKYGPKVGTRKKAMISVSARCPAKLGTKDRQPGNTGSQAWDWSTAYALLLTPVLTCWQSWARITEAIHSIMVLGESNWKGQWTRYNSSHLVFLSLCAILITQYFTLADHHTCSLFPLNINYSTFAGGSFLLIHQVMQSAKISGGASWPWVM